MSKDNPVTATGCLVWGICVIFFLYEFLLRTVMGTFQHPIMNDLQLTSFKFSLLSTTTYHIMYAFMQIPAGLIINRWGLKKSLFSGAIVCSLASIGFGYANNYPTAVTARVFMGMGSSIGFLALLVAIYDWMPNRYSALLIGISQLIGTMGPMLAAGPLNALSENTAIAWRTIFIILGITGFIISLAIFIFVRNNHDKAGNYIILNRPEKIIVGVRKLFSRLQPWSIALFSAFAYFSLEYLSENEGQFFVTLKGHSSTFASYAITLSWLGYALGCPLLGFLSDTFQRRRKVMTLGTFIGAIAITLIVFAQNKYCLMLAFFCLGIGGSAQSIGFAIIAEQFKKKYLAIGLSLNNTIIMLLIALNAPFMSLIIEGVKTSETPLLGDYHLAFSFLIGITCLAAILSLFAIKETFCKSVVDFTYLNRHS